MNKLKLIFACIAFTSALNAQEINALQIPQSYKNHPEYGKIHLDNDPTTIELIHLRTENSRTFIDQRGQYHTQQTGGYFHFKDNNGQWISIQEEVSADKSNTGHLGIFQSEMPMSVNPVNGKTTMSLEKNGKSIAFGENVTMRFTDKRNNVLQSSASNRSISNVTHNAHEIKLGNFFPKVDRVQTLEYWSLQTDYLLNEKLDLPENTHQVEFSDEMQLPSGWTISYGEGEMKSAGWAGNLYVMNSEGNIVSKISNPLLYDSFGSNRKEDMKGHVGMGTYQLERTNSGYIIKLIVPAAWLNNEALVYPVTIDPTATNTYASNQAVQDKNTQFNANCQVTMAVTMPAGTYQVTGTNTSWRMWAKGFIYGAGFDEYYADKVEQRSRVGAHLSGTAWSATQSGSGTNHSGSSYNYTANNNGLTYTLNNQSMANGCYNTSTITYIWQGYQTYFPLTFGNAAARVAGCTMNYQELVTNTWVVTTTYNVLVLNMTVTPTSQSICSGQATAITMSSTTPNTTYAWTVAQSGTSGGANGSGSTIAQTLTATGTTPGTATYTITPTHGSCPGTPQTVVVTVNPAPIINGGADQSVCAGSPVTLTGTGGAAGATYTWNNGVTNGVPFTPTATATYTVTSQGTGGCAGTDQVLVTVNALPVINPGADQSVCAGAPVTLTATGTPSTTVFTWNNGVTNGVVFNPTATATYTVTGTANGCTATAQVTVTVTTLPGISAGNDVSICEGATVTLTGTGGTPGTTYTWDNGVTDGVAFTPTATTTYTVIGAIAGCSGTDQVLVTVNPKPVVNFTPSVTLGCLPLAVTFTPNPLPAQGTTNQWNFGDGIIENGAGNMAHTYTASGCFDVTLTSTTAAGCTQLLTMPGIVCTSPTPDAQFVANPSTLSLQDAFATMVNTTTGATSYLWNFGDGTPTSTVPAPGHNFPSGQGGSYMITLVAYSAGGCTDTARTSIQVHDDLIYYIPNSFTPDDDQHNPVFKPVFTSGYDPYDYTLLVFNRWGETIFESHDASVGWDGTYGNGVSILPDGTYSWRIEFKTKRSDERKLLVGHITLIR